MIIGFDGFNKNLSIINFYIFLLNNEKMYEFNFNIVDFKWKGIEEIDNLKGLLVVEFMWILMVLKNLRVENFLIENIRFNKYFV